MRTDKGTPQIVGVGHNCLDRLCTVEAYPPEDGSTHITSISVQGGGAVATALAASARLGIPSALAGHLGEDETGREIRALLEADGVDTRYIRAIPGGRSSVSYVMVDPRKSTRTKFPYPDDLPAITWDEELTALIEQAAVLHLDGTRYENALAAAKIAKAAGVTVSLDGCSMQGDNEKNIALASMADILIMNAKYPLRVSGREDYGEALLEMAGWGPKVVIGTQGAQGCLAVIDPAFPRLPGGGDRYHRRGGRVPRGLPGRLSLGDGPGGDDPFRQRRLRPEMHPDRGPGGDPHLRCRPGLPGPAPFVVLQRL